MNLFLLPQAFILGPVFLFLYCFLKRKSKDHVVLRGIVVAVLLFDGVNAVFGTTTLDALKVASLLGAGLIYLSPGKWLAKLGIYWGLFLVWIFLRDAAAFLDADHLEIRQIIYSFQFYVLTAGYFAVAFIVLNPHTEADAERIAMIAISVFLFLAVLVATYQYLAFTRGWPINGIRSAFSQSQGYIKYAAFNIDGVVVFRSYGLNLEPKFLANLAVVSFAYLLHCFSIGSIRLWNFALLVSVIAWLIFISASTSAVVSIAAVLIVFTFMSGMSLQRKLLFVGLALAFFFLTLFYFESEVLAVFEERIAARLLDESASVTEQHEEDYLNRWFEDPFSVLMGWGYFVFSEEISYFGFREIPNSALIFHGVSGGVIQVILYALAAMNGLRHFRQKAHFLPCLFVYAPPSVLFFSIFLMNVIDRVKDKQTLSTVQTSVREPCR